MNKDFRIGFADAFHAPCGKTSAKVLVIFNDAVVNEVNGSVSRNMGVGVNLCNTSVGGPARVGDASRPAHLCWEDGFQIGHFPDGFVGVNIGAIIHGNTG